MSDSKQAAHTAGLGELEAAIMNVVWQRRTATVEQVRAALAAERDPAYTTVMTVMSRLTAKGLLERKKDGRAYVYRPKAAHAEVAGSALSNLVARLYPGSPQSAIAHLIETEEEVGEDELARLEELIRERRRRNR